MRNIFTKAALAASLFLAGTFSARAADAPIVSTAQGEVVGAVKGASHLYFGIPYAAPPVGDLRWRAPALAPAWAGVHDARKYGAKCPQAGFGAGAGKEDCLFINVTAPANRAGGKLPVAVWIHGGSFKSGSGEYGGETFARDGVIFVSMNYRLGPLGGFAHPALRGEVEQGQPHSNYGMLDQIAALKWVKDNIAAFGGNPEKVTIFGESAGGTSVAYLVASPLTKGLFRGAIVQSGAAGLVPSEGAYEARGSVPPMVDRGVALANAMGLRNPTAAQLRQASAAALVRANGKLFLGGPVVDGVSLPDGVAETFATGRQQPVALIAGANSDEATLSAVIPLSAKSDAFLKANIEKLAPLYGRPQDANDTILRRRFYGDVYFVTQMRALARGMTRSGGTGYLYHFAYDLEACRSRPNYYGVGHAGELLHTFDVIGALPRLPAAFTSIACSAPGPAITPTPADRRMATIKHGLWVNFMKNGAPSAPGVGVWPPYSPQADRTMRFSNDGAASEDNLFKERLDFIEANYDDAA